MSKKTSLITERALMQNGSFNSIDLPVTLRNKPATFPRQTKNLVGVRAADEVVARSARVRDGTGVVAVLVEDDAVGARGA